MFPSSFILQLNISEMATKMEDTEHDRLERRGTTMRRLGILDDLSDFWDDCQQLYRSLTFARDLTLDEMGADVLLRGARELAEKAINLIRKAMKETANTSCEAFPRGNPIHSSLLIIS